MSDALEAQIKSEIEQHKILVYGKGTKDAPRCGFTLETIEFFNQFGYPFEVINALADEPKRAKLSEITNWPTLPKVFINGNFTAIPISSAPCKSRANCKPSYVKHSKAKNRKVPRLLSFASMISRRRRSVRIDERPRRRSEQCG